MFFLKKLCPPSAWHEPGVPNVGYAFPNNINIDVDNFSGIATVPMNSITNFLSLLKLKSPKSASVAKKSPNYTSPTSMAKASSKSDSSIKVVESGEFAGMRLAKGEIKVSFYQDARNIGVPAGVVDSVIRNMGSKVNFRHALKRGDKFEVMYSRKGEMLYAKIKTKAGEASVYKFAQNSAKQVAVHKSLLANKQLQAHKQLIAKRSVPSPQPESAYYMGNGEKIVASNGNNQMFGLPLRVGMRISDGFGYRRHPVTGVRHYHSGVDFPAPYGTPIYAIYDGIVTRCCYYYGYGNCVDIKHASGYASRYAHLSKYAVRYGTKVKKGQIIGYVGSTGHSTGPHLHLELARNNVTINPLGVKMMPEERKTAINVVKFNQMKKKVDSVFSK
jgi:murein DD-endopeptidase MepM/ murein hydrolase activator NlpD